jgi:hypothetical protein
MGCDERHAMIPAVGNDATRPPYGCTHMHTRDRDSSDGHAPESMPRRFERVQPCFQLGIRGFEAFDLRLLFLDRVDAPDWATAE